MKTSVKLFKYILFFMFYMRTKGMYRLRSFVSKKPRSAWIRFD